MFGFITNTLKAAASVALTPVALVVDTITLPASATDLSKGPFDRTGALLSNAAECLDEALKPEKN